VRRGAGTRARLAGMRAAALAFGLACGLVPPAAAQEQGASSEDDLVEKGGEDIVVTGRAEEPPTRREVSRQARAITRPQNVYDLPLARFEDRLCPGVLGLKAEYAALLIDRIRYHAQRLDMWLTEDDGTCTPNLILAFVDDGQAELAALQDAHGYLFQDLPTHERRALLAEEGPVRVWTTTATRTRDGMPIARRESLTDPPVVQMAMAHSKIYLTTREDITQVVVLFDRKGTLGKTLVQLADYATMRGLARTRPVEADGQPLDTILALFDAGSTPPAEMTEFDRAYLGALYDGLANMPGVTKVLGVNRQLRLQEKAEAEEAAE
jgi:hypothetical protein